MVSTLSKFNWYKRPKHENTKVKALDTQAHVEVSVLGVQIPVVIHKADFKVAAD